MGHLGELVPDVYSTLCRSSLGITRGTVTGKLLADWLAGERSGLINFLLRTPGLDGNPPEPLLSLGVSLNLRWGQYRAGRGSQASLVTRPRAPTSVQTAVEDWSWRMFQPRGFARPEFTDSGQNQETMMTNPTTSIEDVPLNAFHRLLTPRSDGGSFTSGYVLSIVGVAMLQMTAALQLSSFWQGMIAASTPIGIFFGGFLGGWLTDRLGHRRLFFVGPSLFVLASLAQYGADSAAALFVLRFLIGMAVGIEYPVATTLLVEFLPRKYRGPRLAVLAVLRFAGTTFAYPAGDLILRSNGEGAWRLVLASTTTIDAVLFLLHIGTPESSRWLLSKGRDADAERVIRQVYGETFSLTNLPERALERKVTIWHLLYASYGKRMLFVTLLWTCSVILVFVVYAFASEVLLAPNLKGGQTFYGLVTTILPFIIGCVIATRLINRISRRYILPHSFPWSGLVLLGLGVSHAGSETTILGLFSTYALFIGGAQVLQLVCPNKLLPTEIRAFAVSVGTSLSRVGAAVDTYLVPLSLETLGATQTMYAAALVALLGLLVTWALASETRSLSLQRAALLT